MTNSQIRDTVLCRSVTKNLTDYRFNSAGWGLDDMKAEIHSFPTMYIIGGGEGGSKRVKTKIFRKKSCQKTAFLCCTNYDQLTLGGSQTHIFEGIANFSMCFEKFGTLSSKWAMGKASIFDSVRLAATWKLFWVLHQKLQKNVFFCFLPNCLRFWYRNTYPGYHHVKANVLTIPKMWWFLGLWVFKRELSLLKVGTLPKFWVRYQK